MWTRRTSSSGDESVKADPDDVLLGLWVPSQVQAHLTPSWLRLKGPHDLCSEIMTTWLAMWWGHRDPTRVLSLCCLLLGEEPDHLEPQSSDVRNGDNSCPCLVGWVLQEVKKMILSTAIGAKEKLYSLQGWDGFVSWLHESARVRQWHRLQTHTVPVSVSGFQCCPIVAQPLRETGWHFALPFGMKICKMKLDTSLYYLWNFLCICS